MCEMNGQEKYVLADLAWALDAIRWLDDWEERTELLADLKSRLCWRLYEIDGKKLDWLLERMLPMPLEAWRAFAIERLEGICSTRDDDELAESLNRAYDQMMQAQDEDQRQQVVSALTERLLEQGELSEGLSPLRLRERLAEVLPGVPQPQALTPEAELDIAA